MSEKQKTRILLVEVKSHNMGEAVITANARHLVEKALGFFGRNRCEIIDYDLRSGDLDTVATADCIVFAGGNLIRYRLDAMDHEIVSILETANEKDIPVFFHGVGIDGYDAEDERCQALKAALRLPCVKEITCRDDIGVLAKSYLVGSSIAAVPVVDPAVWTGTTYRDILELSSSDVIGLGISKANMFTEYGIDNIDHDFLLDFWKNVAAELERRGRKWVLFTNGPDEDEAFAEEVLREIGHGEKLPQPTSPDQFVRAIRSLGGLIACRLHSNVIAYSLEIPSVGLVWNDKLTLWGYKCGHPERFIQPEMFDPEYVVNVLELALQTGCDPITKDQKSSSYKELKKFLQEYAG